MHANGNYVTTYMYGQKFWKKDQGQARHFQDKIHMYIHLIASSFLDKCNYSYSSQHTLHMLLKNSILTSKLGMWYIHIYSAI